MPCVACATAFEQSEARRLEAQREVAQAAAAHGHVDHVRQRRKSALAAAGQAAAEKAALTDARALRACWTWLHHLTPAPRWCVAVPQT